MLAKTTFLLVLLIVTLSVALAAIKLREYGSGEEFPESQHAGRFRRSLGKYSNPHLLVVQEFQILLKPTLLPT